MTYLGNYFLERLKKREVYRRSSEDAHSVRRLGRVLRSSNGPVKLLLLNDLQKIQQTMVDGFKKNQKSKIMNVPKVGEGYRS